MSYTLRIERIDGVISLEEWTKVVEQTEGVRLCAQEEHTTMLPRNGSVLAMKVTPGDTEAFDDESQCWRFCFRMYDDSIEFNARVVYRALDGKDNDPMWKLVWSLAQRLQASIIGEEGEVYGENAKAAV